MKRKAMAILLAGLMACTSLVGCGSSGKASSGEEKEATEQASSEENSGKYTTVKLSTIIFNNLPNEEEKENVENAINSYIAKKTNVPVKIKLDYYDTASYAQQITMQISAGEDVDLVVPMGLGGTSSCISQGYIMPITDLAKKYCGDAIKEAGGDKELVGGMFDGKLYTVPVNRGYSTHYYFIYRKDLLEKAGMKKEDIKTVDDMEKALIKVHKQNPDIIPLAPLNANTYYFDNLLAGGNGDRVDFLGTGPNTASAGCVVGDSGKVVNYYGTDTFRKACELAYRMRKEGLLTKDTSVSPDSAPDLLSAGRCFATIGGYANGAESIAKRFSAYGNNEMDCVELATPYIVTGSNAISWGVASTCKHPKEALEALNLVLTDKTLVNYIMYGIEGTDYVLKDDGSITFPEGKDISTVPYTLCSTSGIVNEIKQYTYNGDLPTDKKYFKESNEKSVHSPIYGFNYIANDVQSERTAVTNVINKYYNSLDDGETDPKTAIPKFNKELKDAGIDTITSSLQAKLDIWKAKNK